MERGLFASAVERRAVCFADIQLGVVVDVLLDDSLERVLGFDVLCGDRAHRYLPLIACEVGETAIAVDSALVLMKQELEFYRERGRALTAVQGFPVRKNGNELGTLLDLVFTAQGRLTALILEAETGRRQVQPDGTLVVGPDALRPAV
jgi:uncharacterized protein YrrD